MRRTPTARRSRAPAGLIAALGLCLLTLAGCDAVEFPRDPNRTLARVLADGRMRVAAADHVPWVVVDGDAPPGGAEAALVEAFARDLGVAVEWRRAPAFEALDALERGDVDLAIGGFIDSAVTRHPGVAPTFAYFTEALVVAAEPEEPVPDDLDGQLVFAAPELMAAGLIRDHGGRPVSARGEDVDLVALPAWKLPQEAVVPTGIVLRRQQHVIAVQEGENAWLMRLERFLRRQRAADLAAALREQAR